MVWNGVRHLVLPAALTVTTFAVVMACGGDDDDKKSTSQAVGPCADAPPSACQKCEDDTGKVKCGPSTDCFSGTDGYCHPGGSS